MVERGEDCAAIDCGLEFNPGCCQGIVCAIRTMAHTVPGELSGYLCRSMLLSNRGSDPKTWRGTIVLQHGVGSTSPSRYPLPSRSRIAHTRFCTAIDRVYGSHSPSFLCAHYLAISIWSLSAHFSPVFDFGYVLSRSRKRARGILLNLAVRPGSLTFFFLHFMFLL